MSKGLGAALLIGSLAIGGCDEDKNVISKIPDARVVRVNQVRDAVSSMSAGTPPLPDKSISSVPDAPEKPTPHTGPEMDDKTTQPSSGIPIDQLVKDVWGPSAELADVPSADGKETKRVIIVSRRRLLMPLSGGRFGRSKFLPSFAFPHAMQGRPPIFPSQDNTASVAKCALDMKKQLLGDTEDTPLDGTEEFMAAALRICAKRQAKGIE